MKRRILVVEDDEDTRSILRAMLEHRGYEMVETETAEDMLERITTVAPDLIVLDIRLPGIDGCEALVQLRSQGYRGPVFLFSEYFDLVTHHVRSCRPDGFFPKSKGPVGLIDAISAKLSHSSAQQ